MPCVWLQHNKSQLFINVAVIDANVFADWTDNGNREQPLQHHMFKALVDTGAQTTMISSSVAKTMQLRPIGKAQFLGVGGMSEHNNYLFHIGFTMVEPEIEPGISRTTLHVMPPPIQGGEMNLENSGFDVLLGMDIVGNGSLAVEGGGTFSFSF